MSRRFAAGMLASALSLLFVVGGAGPASAKEFRIAAVQIEAVLRPDASMQVVEHITYDFQGEFHNGTRPIPRGDYVIVDMSVSEKGTALPFDGAPHDLAWHYDARDERRTFDISYTVFGAAKVGADVGELHWKFVGDEHPGVGEVRVALEVPGDGLDVRAWAHGPLNGRIQPDGNRVLFSVSDLPSGRFVEARVTVPAGNFTAEKSVAERLPAVLAEEGLLVEEANRSRASAAVAARRREQIRAALERWFWLAPLAGWGVFVFLWRRYGREHEPTVDTGEYVREPPDDAPAFVPMLFAWGNVEPIALSATIVDLAQRGYLTIAEVREDRRILSDKVDWVLTWKQNDAPVRDFEHTVLARLFADGPEITQSEFKKWCERHRTDADRWWRRVKREMGGGFHQLGYLEGGKGAVFGANVLCGIAVVGVGIAAAAAGAMLGVAGAISGVGQLAATILLRRRTRKGAQRMNQWDAFRRFLKDFSQLGDAPVGHLILWERFLVYAVALGVTAEVARALAARIPAMAEAGAGGGSTFAPWFSGGQGPGALDSIGSFSGFAGGFGPTIVAAAHPPSSSSSGSGSGGGFSGGGGGGGGGGGIGAS